MTSTSVRGQLNAYVTLMSIRNQQKDVNVEMTPTKRRYYVSQR